MESLLVVSNGCMAVLTLGEPTGLELPEVDDPGSGRLLPAVGETVGGVTDDMIIVGGVMDASKVRFLLSVAVFMSTVNKYDVATIVVDVEIVAVVFESTVVGTGALPSIKSEVLVVVVGVTALVSAVELG